MSAHFSNPVNSKLKKLCKIVPYIYIYIFNANFYLENLMHISVLYINVLHEILQVCPLSIYTYIFNTNFYLEKLMHINFL